MKDLVTRLDDITEFSCFEFNFSIVLTPNEKAAFLNTETNTELLIFGFKIAISVICGAVRDFVANDVESGKFRM